MQYNRDPLVEYRNLRVKVQNYAYHWTGIVMEGTIAGIIVMSPSIVLVSFPYIRYLYFVNYLPYFGSTYLKLLRNYSIISFAQYTYNHVVNECFTSFELEVVKIIMGTKTKHAISSFMLDSPWLRCDIYHQNRCLIGSRI